MRVEVDKCAVLDVVVDYENEAKKRGMRLDYHYPLLAMCLIWKTIIWWSIKISWSERFAGK